MHREAVVEAQEQVLAVGVDARTRAPPSFSGQRSSAWRRCGVLSRSTSLSDQNGPQLARDRQDRVSLGHGAECNFPPLPPDKRMFDLLDLRVT